MPAKSLLTFVGLLKCSPHPKLFAAGLSEHSTLGLRKILWNA